MKFRAKQGIKGNRDMRIIRVFPDRTSYTPDDEYVFIGMPPFVLPEHDEVHISCTFTWDRKKCEELAYKILQEEVIESRPLLKKRVETIIEQYDFNEISTTIADVVYECVMNKLFKESEKE